jgi:hypothetical protein
MHSYTCFESDKDVRTSIYYNGVPLTVGGIVTI